MENLQSIKLFNHQFVIEIEIRSFDFESRKIHISYKNEKNNNNNTGDEDGMMLNITF